MPLPGANGYAVIPPRQGFTTQVLPMPGGGWMVVPPEGHSTTVLPLPGDGSAATAPFSAAHSGPDGGCQQDQWFGAK
jgi:hypothetical protein